MNLKDRRTVLLVVLISSFVTPFMSSSVNVALPAISKQFNLDAISLNWVAASYLLSTAIFLLPIGRIADIYGRAGIFTAGMIIFGISSLVAGIANSYFMLLGARIVQGIGSAFVFSTGVAMLSAAYKPEIRGKMLGISVAMVYIGLTAGPFLGGYLTQMFSWRGIFLLIAPFCLAGFILSLTLTKEDSSNMQKGSIDIIGSVIYALGLLFLIYGFSLLPKKGHLFILIGICSLVFFIFWEKKQQSPLFNLRFFTANRVFAFSNLAALINYSATFSSGFLISLYLQYIKGLSPDQAGLILVASPVIMAFIAPFSGRFSDSIDARILSSIGMTVLAAGLSMLIFLNNATPTAYIVTSLIIMGTGFGVFSSPNTNAIMGAVSRKDYGMASGMLATMRMVGQTMSMAVVMLIFSAILGRVEIMPEHFDLFLQALRACFILNTVICVFGIFASLARDKNLPLR